MVVLSQRNAQKRLILSSMNGQRTKPMVTSDHKERKASSIRLYRDYIVGLAIPDVPLERPRHRRHMSLTPAYQKARLGIVEFLRACRRGAA